ncbi:uncharacterized protein JCM6883_002895 [Sporobolomyces salmoneus]|uniref:uncharacterized protein n=1 Tax=Sporobolomyces salmoneus TaxID=183962 RepID=UPI0031732837
MTDKLSSLPLELLRDIIEATVPHTYHSTTYAERRHTLRSLSLVSRQLRSIAQPLLFEIVHIRSNPQLNLLVSDEKETLGSKVLILERYLKLKPMKALLGSCQNLESLLLKRPAIDKELDLGVLADYTKLVNLHISGSALNRTISRPCIALRSLALDHDAVRSVVGSMLNPQHLPSLRALGLQLYNSFHSSLETIGPDLARLLPQLDAICVNTDLYRVTKDNLLSKYSPSILVDVYPAHLNDTDVVRSLASAHHLRVMDKPGAIVHDTDISDTIFYFIAALGTLKTSALKSIYLDASFRPSRISIEAPGMTVKMERVLEACKGGGIEVIF